VEPFDAGYTHRRHRRRRTVDALERLEPRELLAWSPLGFSLPDLTVRGIAAPVTSYGGPLTVTIEVDNLGASSMIEPLALQPGSTSSADAPPSQVGVYVSRSPHFGPGAIPIGTVAVPAVPQKGVAIITDTLTMPARQRGLPPNGGTLHVFFRADVARQVVEADETNNLDRRGVPVRVEAGLPDLFAIALDTPPNLQPGQTIQPTVQLANYGTVDPAAQGPFQVQLVLSTDRNFGPGDTILQSFTVAGVPPLSAVPMQDVVLGDVNIDPPVNIINLTPDAPLTLPSGPSRYFLGVIVDPDNQIRELSEVGRPFSPALDPVVRVGPPTAGLLPPGPVTTPAPPTNVFPIPPFGPIPSLLNPPEDVTTAAVAAPAGPVVASPAQARAAARRAAIAAARRPG
jgi:hypothetical protein